MMEHTGTVDDGEASIQITEFENIGLGEVDARNTALLAHPCSVCQAREAQIDCENRALRVSSCEQNQILASAASRHQHRHWASMKADWLVGTETQPEFFEGIGRQMLYTAGPDRIGMLLVLVTHRLGYRVIDRG